MIIPAPERGAGADDPTGLSDLWQDRPAGHLGWVNVRTCSSYADPNQFCPLSQICVSAIALASSPGTQSEGDLAVPEAAGRRAEGRPSGKSGAARSDRRETSGGVVRGGAVRNLHTTPLRGVNGGDDGLVSRCTSRIGGESSVRSQ